MTLDPLKAVELSDLELLQSSDLFDPDHYLATYPDIAQARVDPVAHYLESGFREGRDPSERFSTRGYLSRYPDVREAGWNPLVHYLRLGQAEGRLPNPILDDIALIRSSGMFDETYYRAYRVDLPAGIDALRHFFEHATEEGSDPSEKFSTTEYLRQFPEVLGTDMNPLVHYLREGLPAGLSAPAGRPLHLPVELLTAEAWPRLQPFPVVRVTGGGPRVTVLTDLVDATTLFGGVGTAIILGMCLANRSGAALRIATTHDPPDLSVLGALQQASGVALQGDVGVAHLPYRSGSKRPLLVGNQDLVITTSWWTTRSALSSTLRREELVYLLQEDERMFYPHGDERLLCSETLDESVMTVVNTARLLDHLKVDFPRLSAEGVSFEPAFPGVGQQVGAAAGGGKRHFFFYSRPGNGRNLFWRGIAALARALEDHVLDPDEWEFHFVGRGNPKIVLPFGVRPHIHEGFDWLAYQSFVADMDAGLVLMDTPHPSYPPLDLAAAGVAVLTNRSRGKDDLSDISRNIVMADLALPSLVEGLGRVAALGADRETRHRNRQDDAIARDWDAALGPVLAALESRMGVAPRGSSRVH